jgi:hypothetical protein
VRTGPPATLRAPPRERVLLLALALAVATLVLVLLLRNDGTNADDSAVQAANAVPASVVPATAPAATSTPSAPQTDPTGAANLPHDVALRDPNNRYTVRLIQYPNDERGLALASEAYRWLLRFGYPVGSPIRLGNGRGIVLCADARPTSAELHLLRDTLRRVRYPESSKTMPFSDAYIDEIDHVLARK